VTDDPADDHHSADPIIIAVGTAACDAEAGDVPVTRT
jgi:hypothetical protein